MNGKSDSRKVIFVGGTSFSGSTLLDMILANDRAGFSLGEIYALFRPGKRHHLTEIRRLRKDTRWASILRGGENCLYRNLFSTFSEVDFFVDSSKEVFWMKKQQRILKRLGIPFRNVLIHKSPAEVALSYGKRGAHGRWAAAFVKYHREYFRLFGADFTSISYKRLVTNPGDLEELCTDLGINYFSGKEKYWEKSHQTFFGNQRAKAHLENFSIIGNENKADLAREGEKTLYYNPPPDSVMAAIESQKLSSVWRIHSILNGNRKNADLPTKAVVLPRLRNFIARTLKKVFYRFLPLT